MTVLCLNDFGHLKNNDNSLLHSDIDFYSNLNSINPKYIKLKFVYDENKGVCQFEKNMSFLVYPNFNIKALHEIFMDINFKNPSSNKKFIERSNQILKLLNFCIYRNNIDIKFGKIFICKNCIKNYFNIYRIYKYFYLYNFIYKCDVKDYFGDLTEKKESNDSNFYFLKNNSNTALVISKNKNLNDPKIPIGSEQKYFLLAFYKNRLVGIPLIYSINNLYKKDDKSIRYFFKEKIKLETNLIYSTEFNEYSDITFISLDSLKKLNAKKDVNSPAFASGMLFYKYYGNILKTSPVKKGDSENNVFIFNTKFLLN